MGPCARNRTDLGGVSIPPGTGPLLGLTARYHSNLRPVCSSNCCTAGFISSETATDTRDGVKVLDLT
jgi:hypothetical protein